MICRGLRLETSAPVDCCVDDEDHVAHLYGQCSRLLHDAAIAKMRIPSHIQQLTLTNSSCKQAYNLDGHMSSAYDIDRVYIIMCIDVEISQVCLLCHNEFHVCTARSRAALTLAV